MVDGIYWSVALVGLLAMLVPVLILGIGGAVGPKGGLRVDSEDKLGAYECGIVPEIDARRRFSVKFYLVAVLFVLFDIEVAFLIPWGVTFRELGAGPLGWGVIGVMALFLGLLVAGLVYLVRRGALEWE